MRKLRKIMLLIPMLVFMTLVLPCEAKTEGETFEIELIDLGNGFQIPKNFDVMDENGNFGTLNMNLSNYDMEPMGEWHEIKLDNGYTARLEWTLEWYSSAVSMDDHEIDLNGNGFKYITVKDENDELVYSAGLNPFTGDYELYMKDEEGNSIYNAYTLSQRDEDRYRNVIYKVEEGEINQEDPGYVKPLERVTYCEETKKTSSYALKERGTGTLGLARTIEVDENGEKICKEYSLVYPDDENGEPHLVLSYKEKDVEAYSFTELRGFYNVHLPKVITRYYQGEGTEYYLYRLTNNYEAGYSPEDWEYAKETGKREERYAYFSQEQIEILERENIKDISEIMEKYPDFFFPPMEILYEGDFETPVDEAEEAIVSTPVIEEPEVEEGAVIGTQSNNVFNQPLTGDVVAINGMTPAAVLTFIENTPAGDQIKIQLVDANYNTILTGMAFDTEHTKYKYAYLTVLDMSGEMMGSPFFQVAGTDSQMSGNLSHVGSEIYTGE